MTKPTERKAWQALRQHHEEMKNVHMRDLFKQDPQRFSKFSLKFNDIFLDFSKNRITEKTLGLLYDLARESDLAGWTEKMFTGQKINTTEDRAVLHVALRNRSNRPIKVDGQDVMPEVNAVLAHMKQFSEAIRSGSSPTSTAPTSPRRSRSAAPRRPSSSSPPRPSRRRRPSPTPPPPRSGS